MTKIFNFILVLVLCILSSMASAMQTCRSQSEIPATTPTEHFVDHGNGTVTDNQTNLMWAKCAQGLSGSGCTIGSATTHNWEAALNLANVSTLAGHNNWRLPNISELRSIVEGQCYAPVINLSVFPNTPALIFWSASPHPTLSSYAWYVKFADGFSTGTLRNYGAYVRLVRSGQ